VDSNNLGDKVFIVAGKIEEIDLPEKVDVIISEPMGYMLYNERMLETYLHAKKWLKPGGNLYFVTFYTIYTTDYFIQIFYRVYHILVVLLFILIIYNL